MSNFNLSNETQDTIDDKVAGCETFTAYEITQRVRRENDGEDVPHQTVRDFVVAAFIDGFVPGYTRERAADIQGQPWRYLPDTDCVPDSAVDSTPDATPDATQDDNA